MVYRSATFTLLTIRNLVTNDKSQGPNTAPTTACTTGAHAIGGAARLVAHGDANIMLAGASEACIHPLAIAGFARARSLATEWNDTPDQASRPFDAHRAGFVMGEGAGMLVLEVSLATSVALPLTPKPYRTTAETPSLCMYRNYPTPSTAKPTSTPNSSDTANPATQAT